MPRQTPPSPDLTFVTEYFTQIAADASSIPPIVYPDSRTDKGKHSLDILLTTNARARDVLAKKLHTLCGDGAAESVVIANVKHIAVQGRYIVGSCADPVSDELGSPWKHAITIDGFDPHTLRERIEQLDKAGAAKVSLAQRTRAGQDKGWSVGHT